MSDKIDKTERKESSWFGRSLENYKSLHAETAEKKGLTEELRKCNTLTKARKLLFGMKKGMTK